MYKLLACLFNGPSNKPLTLCFLTFLGVSLNPIIVYCSNQEDMDNWFGLLKEHIEANGGTAIKPDTYSRVKVQSYQHSVLILCLEKEIMILTAAGVL